MPRIGDSHCKKNCQASRCKGLSKSSNYKNRCCLCTKHESGLCHHHQKIDGARTQVRGTSRSATIGSGVSIKTSTIQGAGKGLFADVAFASNDIITRYDGRYISRNQAYKIPNQTHIAAKGGLFVDGIRNPKQGLGGGSFANDCHSKPNCKYNAEIVDHGDKLYLKVKKGRVIKPKEEIFLNYGLGRDVAMGKSRKTI